MQSEERPIAGPQTIQELVPAQVPRRFPVGTLLLLTSVFAALLSVLRTAGVRTDVIVFIAIYVIMVGLAQVLLFKGKNPRTASLCAGVAAWLLLAVGIAIYTAWCTNENAGEAMGWMLCTGVIFAAPLGYVIGAVLAGLFLILDRIRTGQWNQVRQVELPATMPQASPFGVRFQCPQPILQTERLRLRPFSVDDAPKVRRLAGDAEVASTTANIPHPYEDGMAEAWILTHPQKYRNRQEVVFAVIRKEDEQFLGAVGLRLVLDQAKAELGYWIGRPYWKQGYATEAARAVVAYGFLEFNLISIFAHHMTRNPASGRVMQKIGMQHKGTLREYLEKNGVREDCHWYEIMRYEWTEQGSGE